MASLFYVVDVILLNRSIADKSASEKKILSSLGKVLANAQDWDGGRKQQAKTMITAISPTEELTCSMPETTTTAQTIFFVNEKNQMEFAQVVENNYNESDDSNSDK